MIIDSIVSRLIQAERIADWFGPPKRSSWWSGYEHGRPSIADDDIRMAEYLAQKYNELLKDLGIVP